MFFNAVKSTVPLNWLASNCDTWNYFLLNVVFYFIFIKTIQKIKHVFLTYNLLRERGRLVKSTLPVNLFERNCLFVFCFCEFYVNLILKTNLIWDCLNCKRKFTNVSSCHIDLRLILSTLMANFLNQLVLWYLCSKAMCLSLWNFVF